MFARIDNAAFVDIVCRLLNSEVQGGGDPVVAALFYSAGEYDDLSL